MRLITNLLFMVIIVSKSTPLFSQDNRCIRLDGQEDYVDFGNIYKDLKLPVTLSVWIKLDASNFFLSPVFATRNCFSTYSGLMLIVDKNYIHVQYGDGFGTMHPAYRRGKEATVNLPHDQWHHVSVVMKDGKTMELYLDGVNVGGDMTGSSANTMDSSTPEGLATAGYFFSNDVTYRFKGAIDDIRLWNRALSPREVADAMCNTLTGKEPGLIGYWTFDEAAGKVCYDKSPNKFHGKVVGSPEREVAVIACGK